MPLDRITRNPAVMGGKPCLRGMRVTAGTLVGLVASGRSNSEILAAYPYLEEEDIRQALAYAETHGFVLFTHDLDFGMLLAARSNLQAGALVSIDLGGEGIHRGGAEDAEKTERAICPKKEACFESRTNAPWSWSSGPC